jgi:hypothetical protein
MLLLFLKAGPRSRVMLDGEWEDIFKDHFIAVAIRDGDLHNRCNNQNKGDIHRIEISTGSKIEKEGLIPDNCSS